MILPPDVHDFGITDHRGCRGLCATASVELRLSRRIKASTLRNEDLRRDASSNGLMGGESKGCMIWRRLFVSWMSCAIGCYPVLSLFISISFLPSASLLGLTPLCHGFISPSFAPCSLPPTYRHCRYRLIPTTTSMICRQVFRASMPPLHHTVRRTVVPALVVCMSAGHHLPSLAHQPHGLHLPSSPPSSLVATLLHSPTVGLDCLTVGQSTDLTVLPLQVPSLATHPTRTSLSFMSLVVMVRR